MKIGNQYHPGIYFAEFIQSSLNKTMCPGNKTVGANFVGCTYKNTGPGWDATGSDNCSTPTVKYTLSGATTSSAGQYTSLNNVVFNGGKTTVSATAYDACDNA